MKTRRIADLKVTAIGLGGLPLSLEGRPDRSVALATIHAALDEGVTFLDTADAYHAPAEDSGHNESLIASAIASWGGDTSTLLVSTKGGHVRPADGSWQVDGRPEHLKEAARASLRRLGGDAIGLYHFHRPDPTVPYADSIGALRDLLDEGLIRLAGISNVNPKQIRQAQKILGSRLASVQNQFSPAFRSSEPEIALAQEMGVAFVAWSPLGGPDSAAALGSRLTPFQDVADERGLTPQVVALAWELSKSPALIPIPGASRPEDIRDSLRALDVKLAAEEIAMLDAARPAA